MIQVFRITWQLTPKLDSDYTCSNCVLKFQALLSWLWTCFPWVCAERPHFWLVLIKAHQEDNNRRPLNPLISKPLQVATLKQGPQEELSISCLHRTICLKMELVCYWWTVHSLLSVKRIDRQGCLYSSGTLFSQKNCGYRVYWKLAWNSS